MAKKRRKTFRSDPLDSVRSVVRGGKKKPAAKATRKPPAAEDEQPKARTVYIGDSLWNQVREKAFRERRTNADIVRQALAQYFS